MFQVGDRVSVRGGDEYGGRYIEHSGKVVRVSYFTNSSGAPRIGVLLDDHHNPSSRYGAYWFKDNSLQTEEEYDMSEYKRARIKFLGNPYVKGYDKAANSTTWVYATEMADLQPGDVLVVHTASHGLAVAEFVEYTEAKLDNSSREIMTRVDLTEYNQRKERAKKILQLKRQMDKTLKEAQDLALYEAIAEKNPAMADLLAEYKKLTQTDSK